MNSPYRERIRYHIRSAMHDAKYSPILGTFDNIKKNVMSHGHGYFNESLVESLLREEMVSTLKK